MSHTSFSINTKIIGLIYLLIYILFPLDSWAKTVITNKGNTVSRRQVNCNGLSGAVEVNTGVSWELYEDETRQSEESEFKQERGAFLYRGSDGIHMRFDKADCHWVQFVKVRIIQTNVDGNKTLLTKSVNSTGGKVTSTTNTGNPKWHVDSSSNTIPLYDSTGANTNSNSESGILDAPDPPIYIAKEFTNNPNIQGIKVIYDFVSYLIHNKIVCYKVEWRMSQKFTASVGPGGPGLTSTPQTIFRFTDPVTNISPGQSTGLNKGYPTQNVLN